MQPAASARELGSVVTARFITREVHTIARVTVARLSKASNLTQAEHRKLSGSAWAHLAELGLAEIETLCGTPIHPIWSVDRDDWVPLGELSSGETLQSADGLATVVSVTLESCAQPIYNIEVHGQHVYQVGELAILVHNAPLDCVVVGQAGEIAGGTNGAKIGLKSILKPGRWRFPDKVDGN